MRRSFKRVDAKEECVSLWLAAIESALGDFPRTLIGNMSTRDGREDARISDTQEQSHAKPLRGKIEAPPEGAEATCGAGLHMPVDHVEHGWAELASSLLYPTASQAARALLTRKDRRRKNAVPRLPRSKDPGLAIGSVTSENPPPPPSMGALWLSRWWANRAKIIT